MRPREREGRTIYAHDGGNNGFVTSLEYDPETKLTIVILCNLGFVQTRELRDDVVRRVIAALDEPNQTASNGQITGIKATEISQKTTLSGAPYLM